MVKCHFASVKEQTANIIEKPFQEKADIFRVPKRDQRCFFKDSSIRVYSRGGSEFVIPTLFQVENVFPIENGIIIQVRHDRDKLIFDPATVKKEANNGSLFGRQLSKEWTYMTVSDHPINDIHPLSFLSQNQPIFEG